MSGLCACGCGAATSFGRISLLAENGLTRQQVAGRMGVSTDYVKSQLQNPARYLKGHLRPDTAMRLNAKASGAESRARRYRDHTAAIRSRKRPLKGDRTRIVELSTRALVADLDAFQWRAMSVWSVERVMQPPDTRLVRASLYVARRRLVERDQEEIDHLRNLVGKGWRMDSEYRDPRLLYMDGPDATGERSWIDAHGYQLEERLAEEREREREREREHAAAAAVMDAPYLARLVRIALTSPQNLMSHERETLRRHYEQARSGAALPMQHHDRVVGSVPGRYLDYQRKPVGQGVVPFGALSPSGGGGLKRGPGDGRGGHRGAYVNGTKRFENREQIAAEMARRQWFRQRERERRSI